MPSRLAETLGLLRFGALPSSEKLRVLDDYLARCDREHGGPHVWNPCVEVIESLWSYTNTYASETEFDGVFRTEDRQLLGEIATLCVSILDHQAVLVDRSFFGTPADQALSSLCAEVVTRLASSAEEELPFWDLMCYTCD
jgi:hypothetical protein